jgi:dsRNA-specific ribonuclease
MMNPQTFTTVKIGELPNDLFLPPLPPIEDKDIEKRVFTHSSTVTSAKSGSLYFQEEGESVDNEKLEYVGDGILSRSM